MANSRRNLIDQRQQVQRKHEFAREDLLKKLNQDKILQNQFKSDDLIERNRKLKLYQQCDEERAMIQAINQEKKDKELREQQRQHEELLLQELQRARDEKLREEKIRQSIRTSSYELRELQQKLDQGYMNKVRKNQMELKAIEKLHLMAEEKHFAESIQQQLDEAQKEVDQHTKEAFQKSHEYKVSLEAQLEEKSLQKQLEIERFLKEKALVDQLIAKIQEEDVMAMKRKYRQQSETRQFIEDYLAKREAWLAQDKLRIEQENQKVQEYLQQQAQRDQAHKFLKLQQDEKKQHIYQQLAENMQENEAQRKELEDLRICLAQAEQDEAQREREKKELQKRIRLRLEMIEAYQNEMQMKRLKRQKEEESEEIYRQRLLKEMEEHAKLEQYTREARRQKQLEHKAAIDALVEQRKLRLEEEKAKELEDLRKDRELEEFKRQVIEQERQRLLREHASQLVGYLPKGVLKDQIDLDIFDEEFKMKFLALNSKQ
ncbi:mannosyl-oligosaccharide alpha-1,2-mannosidase [Coelomomyces lativittatus]|nr:mannosyl-oligosaccharide alpha-1,2-mannosidase [Coelomomyces lativittatus]KAJ1514962.1 mannosyl-oligosaccharide alpha-1,2-mannosidase [Coelomomyces lativittatus]KAJ1517229.1 mannosyl-oligosaccharide alpha-1,2-mannosidase [Coelomomyces lativittatus]